MKKSGMLNSEISRVLSYMGHTDTLGIGDCGLPIPGETERIDLALEKGVPGFMQVLKPVSKEMVMEKVLLAEEIREKNPELLKEIQALFQERQEGFQIEFVSHEEFKRRTKFCKAVIRTGEATPYANIILQSGCLF